jgi:hypothetical protein
MAGSVVFVACVSLVLRRSGRVALGSVSRSWIADQRLNDPYVSKI